MANLQQTIEALTRQMQALTEQQRAGLRNIAARDTGSASQSSFQSWLVNQTGTHDVAKGFRETIKKHQSAIADTEIPTAAPAQKRKKLGWRGATNALLRGFGVNYQFDEKSEAASSSNIKGQHDKKVKLAGAKMESTGKDPSGISGKEATHIAEAAAGDPIAIAQVAEEEAEKKKKLIEKMGSEGKAMANSRHGLEAGAHGLRGAAAYADSVDSTGTLSAPLKFGAALMESVEKVRKFTDEVHQTNMQFAEFSGSMAAVQAQSEARDFERNRRTGDVTSGSAGRLANARGNLEDQTTKFDRLWSNVKNELTATFDNGIATILKPLGIIADWIGEQEEKEGNYDMNQIAGNIYTQSDPGAARYIENYGKPEGWDE